MSGATFAITQGDTVSEELRLRTRDLDQSACRLTHAFVADDESVPSWKRSLKPLAKQRVTMGDGTHTFSVRCPSVDGTLKGTFRAIVVDRQPEACKGFEFTRDEITATSFDELASGIVGTWTGCVTTPWTPMYAVTFVLRGDGTYSASSDEVLDTWEMTALYYGTDKDSPLKKYALTDLQASGLGLGEIDVYFEGVGSVNRDELRNIRLMGDKLEFEMFHQAVYGPITFQLVRAS